MSRPERTETDRASADWVTRIEANFSAIFGAPVSFLQTDATTLDGFNPKKYSSCVALISGAFYISDGTSWEFYREQLDAVTDLDTTTATVDEVLLAHNNLLTDLQDKGWMSAS